MKRNVYSFLKVTLLDVPDTVSRTLAIKDDLPLADLHWVLCILFQWSGNPDHEFQTPCRDFSNRPQQNKGDKVIAEDQFTLEHCLFPDNDTFMYILDFRKCYRHLISRIEGRSNVKKTLTQRIQCIEIRGENPFSSRQAKSMFELNKKLKARFS